MPRMPYPHCDQSCQSKPVSNASDNIKLKILEDKLRNDLVQKDLTDLPEVSEVKSSDYLYLYDSEQEQVKKISANEILNQVDLDDYAKKSDLFNKDYNELENKPELFSGNYDDLSNKPEIPSIEGLASETYVQTEIGKIKFPETDLSNYYNKSEVDALIPDVPTKVSELENDKNYLTEHQDLSHLAAKEHTHEDYLTDLPEHTHSYNDLTDKPELFNGDYNSLTNKPEIPEAYNDSELRNLINSKAASDHTHEEYSLVDHKHKEYLTEHQSLEEYAKKTELFSKDYNDLNNKPTIPSIEGLATEDYVDEAIANIDIPEVPTKVSELENDSKYTTEEYVDNAIANIEHPANPTKVSELENDANYTNETKVLELIDAIPPVDLSNYATLADLQIGEDFTTDIKVGHLEAGVEVKATMTFGDLLKRILRCEHEWIDATCTTPKTCKLCGKTEGEALGHIEEVIEGKAATCEESGLTEGVRCSRCGEILVEQQVIPALGHNYTSEVTLEPTCTTDGIRTYTCSNGCGETYTEVIPALGHNYVSEVIKPATCTEEGIRRYACTRCGDTYEEVIPVLEHKQATREENRIEPDCTADGSYEKVTYCTECGEVLNRETIILPALGHDYGDWVITKQPEVGVPGEQQKTCKRCGDVVTEEIPALPKPEAKVYYLGPISCEEIFDYPEYWDDSNYAERTQHYFNNMEEIQTESIDNLVGQHIYSIKHKLSADEEYGYSGDITTTYSAIAIPSDYEVVAWSTDAAGSYPVTAIKALEMSNDYTIYYAEDPVSTINVNDYYITIAKK